MRFAPALSVGEVLKFTASATHEVNDISKPQVGDGSVTDGDRGVMVLERLLYYLLNKKAKQSR
ncbi:hypothetical protein DPMN_012288 [Dreissena polymorpha]|uniref:Uncharacterized protein n=1 Tax=Dreissena polymorpha TaxID=45954 RepID=A0A9D4S169_DREPO|nr:hypothetical protein DPMN_012288 [Dreissena polymorpha]